MAHKSDADAAAAKAGGNTSYHYPAGYSTTQKPAPAAGGAQGGNPALWDVAYAVSVLVTNVGTQHAGRAVAQAYVQFPPAGAGGFDTPVIQLRDFAKTATLQAWREHHPDAAAHPQGRQRLGRDRPELARAPARRPLQYLDRRGERSPVPGLLHRHVRLCRWVAKPYIGRLCGCSGRVTAYLGR